MDHMHMNDKKWHLFFSAVTLFAQSSFSSVSISAICQRSGITPGTFYSYFETKDELLQCVYRCYERLFLEYEADWELLMQQADIAHPHSVLKKALLHTFPKEDERLFFLLSRIINCQVSSDPRARRVLCRCMIELPRKLRPIIEKMIAARRIEPLDIDSFLMLYYSGAYYAAVQPHPKRFASFTHSSWERAIDFLLTTVRLVDPQPEEL